MRYAFLIPAAAALALALPALADDKPTEAEIARINEVLAAIQCEVSADDIEKEDDGGFELDDVYCADGQYDMEMNAAFEITEKRKE